MELTVFQFLDRMQRLRSAVWTPGQFEKDLESCCNQYLAEYPDCSSLSDVIEQEYSASLGAFNEQESTLVRWFLTIDYESARDNARSLLQKAARNWYDGFDINYRLNLADAGKDIARAEKSLRLEMRVFPGEETESFQGTGFDKRCYDALFQELDDMKDELHLRSESPLACFYGILPLHREMKKAVKAEKYERAAELRDEIRKIQQRVSELAKDEGL
jgi:hypothetical protein